MGDAHLCVDGQSMLWLHLHHLQDMKAIDTDTVTVGCTHPIPLEGAVAKSSLPCVTAAVSVFFPNAAIIFVCCLQHLTTVCHIGTHMNPRIPKKMTQPKGCGIELNTGMTTFKKGAKKMQATSSARMMKQQQMRKHMPGPQI